MENTDGSGSSSNLNSANVKPVVVRVKRKISQSPVEAFWLEINERPYKRSLLDLGKLSLSDSRQKEEVKNTKVFLQHVETVSSSEATVDILQSFVPDSGDSSEFRMKVEERRRFFKEENKQTQLLSRSKQNHEFLAKNARFEQIWKSRKAKTETKDKGLREMCHLYDVLRVDNEENVSNEKEEPKDISIEDRAMLCEYLPMLREFLPSIAEEIQSEMQSYSSNQGSADGFVYDLYTVQDELTDSQEDLSNTFPLVQVNEDDDFYDGPSDSEFESDDSNAEDNPRNDYPDEESSDDEDKDKSQTSCEDSEEAEDRCSDDDDDEAELQDRHCALEDDDAEEYASADYDYDENEKYYW
ncbi:Rna-directed dna methylation [Thalictrum thalictroides]|uniref:Rna-directed dna methylation n=1 Tax=Thalictrum thalictroides TaxID=46969 RepID=A0A7J6XGK4_THATH|nr:Rna-directed dna methylation [Thalictrum thalictroides]